QRRHAIRRLRRPGRGSSTQTDLPVRPLGLDPHLHPRPLRRRKKQPPGLPPLGVPAPSIANPCLQTLPPLHSRTLRPPILESLPKDNLALAPVQFLLK